MMSQVANRYAKALLQDRDLKEAQKIAADLAKVQKLIDTISELKQVIRAKVTPQELAYDLAKHLAGVLKLQKITLRFLEVLIQNRRFRFLENIIEAVQQLLHKMMNEQLLEVTTAYPLSLQEKETLRSTLEDKLKSRVLLSNTVDSKVIAGMRIKSDTYLFDGTVLAQLSQIKTCFKEVS